MKKVVFAVIVLAFASLSFAQTPSAVSDNNHPQAALATAGAQIATPTLSDTRCQFTFTSGSGSSFLQYCVTPNGNILDIQMPQGISNSGGAGEGYAVCDLNSGLAYYDYQTEINATWGDPVVLSSTATAVKIARSTTDGIWTLTQTITQVAGTSPSVKILMALKNNTAVDRTVRFLRFIDADADNALDNNLDGTANSAFAWNSTTGSGNTFGLVLQNVGNSPFSHEGFGQPNGGGPTQCNTFPITGKPQLNTGGSLVLVYGILVPKHASKSVTVAYKGL